MAKKMSSFVCQQCGANYGKWQGQCDQCRAWGSLVEFLEKPDKTRKEFSAGALQSKTTSLEEVLSVTTSAERMSTGLDELDRVLGCERDGQCGVVNGGVVLIGGEPGIGKSTLLTQVVVNVIRRINQKEGRAGAPLDSQSQTPGPVLYVCGEESPQQVALRVRRVLNLRQGETVASEIPQKQLVFVSSTDIDEIIALIEQHKPRFVVIDSIQTIESSEMSGQAGSIGQIREVTERIIRCVKPLRIPTFLVGHVTKEGGLAGPKVLEHMVDAVLEMSGERTEMLRIVRALKNRFGATDEVGVFQVVEDGLAEVKNPSQVLVTERDQPAVGAAVSCIVEGTRPVLVEVQALVIHSELAMPRRVGRGIDPSRIQVLSAVLQKHGHLPLGTKDIFVSIVGGFKVSEPALDLAVAMAIASSLEEKALPLDAVWVGEVGLLGEVRPVNYLQRREKEAKRMGYKTLVTATSHQTILALIKKFFK
jgi:DNA repair protein RadA/Sms